MAFEGTGCRGSAGKLAPFVPQVLMLIARVINCQLGGGGGRGMVKGSYGSLRQQTSKASNFTKEILRMTILPDFTSVFSMPVKLFEIYFLGLP